MIIDTTIIAAVITSVVTIFAAILGAIIQRKPISDQDSSDRKYLSRLSFLNRPYSILERKRDGNLVAIRNGISIYAGVFHIFWAAVNGLWGFIFTWLLIFLLFFTNAWAMCYFGKICFVFNHINMILLVTQVAIPLYMLHFGNRLLVQKLTSSSNLLSTSHYEEVAVIYANSKLHAIERYADTRGI